MPRSHLEPENESLQNEADKSIFTSKFIFVLVTKSTQQKPKIFKHMHIFDAAWNALCLACVDLKCCIYRVVLDLYMSLYVFHLGQVISTSGFRAS